jgi:hypothetical protein
MTVRTNDIALRYFGKDSIRTRAADHLTDKMRLCRRVAVIELHDVWGKSLAAIVARCVAQSIQKVSLSTRSHPFVLDPIRFATARPAPVMCSPLSPSSLGMAVRADDITLRYFCNQHVAVLEQCLIRE